MPYPFFSSHLYIIKGGGHAEGEASKAGRSKIKALADLVSADTPCSFPAFSSCILTWMGEGSEESKLSCISYRGTDPTHKVPLS